MIIFDGKQLAEEKELQLKERVAVLAAQGKKLKIAAVLFAEDAGSIIYTRLKKEAAERIGIEYQVDTFSLKSGVEEIMTHIHKLNDDASITGIIIQKPWRQTWEAVSMVYGSPQDVRQAFGAWWILLTSQIELSKDVDGLHPKTLAAIDTGDWKENGRVMPATAAAVFTILKQAAQKLDGVEESEFWQWLAQKKVAVLGKSDIVGKPIYFELKSHQIDVEMLGSAELKRKVEQQKALFDKDIIISATGRKHLITTELVSDNTIFIDVGEPQPDMDQASLAEKASFLTPVPGGVGPLTVVSLLENAVTLVK
jgi:methylenetetrahydrofolate dehydrogenase (NADP+)/methenyltetrahydrofolate cyclohydrolase